MENEKKPPKKQLPKYIQYTSMGFSLLGACLLGYLIGNQLDQWQNNESSLWTALCISFFALAYLAKVVIDLTKS